MSEGHFQFLQKPEEPWLLGAFLKPIKHSLYGSLSFLDPTGSMFRLQWVLSGGFRTCGGSHLQIPNLWVPGVRKSIRKSTVEASDFFTLIFFILEFSHQIQICISPRYSKTWQQRVPELHPMHQIRIHPIIPKISMSYEGLLTVASPPQMLVGCLRHDPFHPKWRCPSLDKTSWDQFKLPKFVWGVAV